MFPFEKILAYIANEQCALVIGPEIMHFEEKPMNMYLRDRLYQQYKNDVMHYYAGDGLFLFPPSDESVKSDVAQSLRQECYKLPQTQGYNESLLKTIARIPFHLIVSINPDTFLSDTFFRFGVTHRFSHFRKGDSPSDEVMLPSREAPLIYNMAGSVLEDESLILDYEDLFSLISSSLGAAGLPENLQTALGNIRSYIFLGFPFEKWYTQVMLRIVCGKATYKKYAGPHHINPDTHTFLANQFKIEFWDASNGDFMAAFMDAAEKYRDADPQKAQVPFLRELLEDPTVPEEAAIIREIQHAKFDKAIAILLAFAKGNPAHEDAASQISGRYKYLVDNQSKIDSREYLTNLNQIADAVIQLARAIAKSK
ncbi:MAG: hypothetical protein SFV22_11230 [Saprospiraceae bacterium]|nr:hypothetical protein [Saprospiraceae bacterium]